jgi:internalin A
VQVRSLIDGVIQEDDPEDFEDSLGDYSGKRDRYRVSRRRFNSTPTTPTINIYNTNQQDQDMSNDKIWNGDRVETKLEGKYINNQSPNSMIGEQTIQGDNIQGDKIVNSQNLSQAAKDIKDLLDEISATDTTNNQTLIAMKAIEAIEKNPTLKQRILNAGKEAGFAAIDAAVEHPAVKIVTAAIKGAIEA